jgi:hypothetical protein
MNNYLELKALSETRKRKISNNTYLVIREDGGLGIRLHDTEVIIHYPDRIVLNTGGWQTVTTKNRMNGFSPALVYSDAGVWMISWHGKEYAYAENITLFNDGTVKGEGTNPKAARKFRKSVNQYAKDYAAAFAAGEVSAPNNGDCWNCLFGFDFGASHIENHIAEKYYVPSILKRGADLGTLSAFAKDYIARTWSPDHDTPDGGMADIALDQIRKTVRKFCFKQCGLSH